MTSNLRVILTPEHVPIALAPAGLGSRFVAFALDKMILLCFLIPCFWLTGLLASAGLAGTIFLTLYFFCDTAYPIFFEVRRQGQTPGKRIVGIRVVDGRGLPISAPQAFTRNIARVVDGMPLLYGLGGLICLMDRHYRRFGDIMADTLVIKETRPVEKAKGLILSAQRFNSLRVPQVLRIIKHKVRLEEREFLLAVCLRAEHLDPKARFDLMEEVGGYYRKKLRVEDPHLSGENIVRDLTSILFGEKEP